MSRSPKAFNAFIKSIVTTSYSENEMTELLSYFTFKELRKNESMVEEGTICPYFCYLETGILHHYIASENEDHTTYIALKNSCAAALKSFVHQIPSRKNIKALSHCELWIITFTDFTYLMNHNTLFFQFYHRLIENQIFLIDDYRINLLTLSPEERYQNLLLNEPTLLQQVPLHYLASFLGISNRHMSRIRKNSI